MGLECEALFIPPPPDYLIPVWQKLFVCFFYLKSGSLKPRNACLFSWPLNYFYKISDNVPIWGFTNTEKILHTHSLVGPQMPQVIFSEALFTFPVKLKSNNLRKLRQENLNVPILEMEFLKWKSTIFYFSLNLINLLSTILLLGLICLELWQINHSKIPYCGKRMWLSVFFDNFQTYLLIQTFTHVFASSAC